MKGRWIVELVIVFSKLKLVYSHMGKEDCLLPVWHFSSRSLLILSYPYRKGKSPCEGPLSAALHVPKQDYGNLHRDHYHTLLLPLIARQMFTSLLFKMFKPEYVAGERQCMVWLFSQGNELSPFRNLLALFCSSHSLPCLCSGEHKISICRNLGVIRDWILLISSWILSLGIH